MIFLQAVPSFVKWNIADYLNGGAFLVLSFIIWRIIVVIRKENKDFKSAKDDKLKNVIAILNLLSEDMASFNVSINAIAANVNYLKQNDDKYTRFEIKDDMMKEINKSNSRCNEIMKRIQIINERLIKMEARQKD